MAYPPAHTATSVYTFGSRSYDMYARTYVMGILNVTPDSFSDGGAFFSTDRAVDRGSALVDEGADFIDIGGESSRPGSEPVSTEEELHRVLPVIESLAKKSGIPLSIDTYKSTVAARALSAGAQIVNDISGLSFDPEMTGVIARSNASVVLMHMKGSPKTMQENPVYSDVVTEIVQFLVAQSEKARRNGIGQIMLDPGIGFGKTMEHNLKLLRELHQFSNLGYPLLVGPSRKSFIGKLLDVPVEERLEGTAAAVTASILRGANVVRVHDVKQMKRVARMADALRRDSQSE
jgi:dihydropteroate synthase